MNFCMPIHSSYSEQMFLPVSFEAKVVGLHGFHTWSPSVSFSMVQS